MYLMYLLYYLLFSFSWISRITSNLKYIFSTDEHNKINSKTMNDTIYECALPNGKV